MINDDIYYRGNVSVKVKTKNKTIEIPLKNSGTNDLFMLLLSALLWDKKITQKKKPNYIFVDKNGVSLGYGYITPPVFITEQNITSVLFTANIPYVDDMNTDGLQITLRDGDKTLLASVDLNTPISGAAGSQVLIEWKMTLSNA